ncbi:putative 2-keto-3-deoxy-galactonate aldolase YagE [Crateriforma conspicua]|uniref:Putative 2-keto-3-deoxy-galactonate aldolase YagE n=1 Tax=Crateriforma conspicua TaxID=2527996 RepID=A0A5C6FWS7_9PLAN|nr:dihydrodipicolinate synthase family protein [Crateriforma conspicua]TWU65473.1 putative 2-keto-3-deoxy-galactonate aldolase YagE [Crateriforma conspicua]
MKRLEGIIPPLVTPLLDRDSLDRDGLDRLVEHVIAGGVSGIFLLGTTGEAPNLSYRLRRELIDLVCRQVNGRVPVLVGISDTAFVESVSLANSAAESGADALVLTTPYYFPVGQTELLGYIRRLTPQLPLPLMLYNMPALTKLQFETETLRQLAEVDQIIGVKDSSGDMDYFADLLTLRNDRPDWSFFLGPEHLLIPGVQMGADGGVNGGANIFPQIFTQAFQAARDGDEAACVRFQCSIDDLQQIYEIGKYASRHIKATKSALSILEICSDFMAEPFHHFKSPERQKVSTILAKLDALSRHT